MLTNNSDVITLSSDEEVPTPPPKRVKLTQTPIKSSGSPEVKRIVLKKVTQITTQCINLSDDDDIKLPQHSKTVEPTATSNIENTTAESILSIPSTSGSVSNGIVHDFTDINKIFKIFLNKCVEVIKVPEQKTALENKLDFMNDAFESFLQHTDNFLNFQESLEFNLQNVINKPKRAIIYFTDIYQLLKLNLRDATKLKQELIGKVKFIRKLERVLGKLKKHIDELEESECNFDDEENSTYIQVGRYKQRASEIHAQLCKYRKLNPYSTRITYQRLKFNESKYPEVNEAINQKYKNSTTFPTYLEIKKLITSCVKNSSLSISDIDINIEAKQCFDKLGNYIQNQRKQELYSLQSEYLLDANDDPAKDNPVLQGELISSYKIKVEEENKLFQKYSAMQEKGIKCDDSEEASIDASDSDNENNGNEANDTKVIECVTID